MADEFQFDLCAGHLALDFANAVSERHTGSPIERLTDFGRLVQFFEQERVLAPKEAKRLTAWAKAHAGAAGALLVAARELREALYAIFAAIASETPPPEPALQLFNQWLKKLRIGASLDWEWAGGGQAPEAPFAALLRAALALMTSADREQVRICGADDCAWIFLDTSKNHSRRWCDMKTCGNRMKARRFHERHD